MTKPGEQFVIRRRAYALIKKAFDENGIKFAFPTVQVAGGEPAAAAAPAGPERHEFRSGDMSLRRPRRVKVVLKRLGASSVARSDRGRGCILIPGEPLLAEGSGGPSQVLPHMRKHPRHDRPRAHEPARPSRAAMRVPHPRPRRMKVRVAPATEGARYLPRPTHPSLREDRHMAVPR